MCLVQTYKVMPTEKQKSQTEECGRALEKNGGTRNSFAREASLRSQNQILSIDKEPFICVIRRSTMFISYLTFSHDIF
jgi:hypothetical protein